MQDVTFVKHVQDYNVDYVYTSCQVQQCQHEIHLQDVCEGETPASLDSANKPEENKNAPEKKMERPPELPGGSVQDPKQSDHEILSMASLFRNLESKIVDSLRVVGNQQLAQQITHLETIIQQRDVKIKEMNIQLEARNKEIKVLKVQTETLTCLTESKSGNQEMIIQLQARNKEIKVLKVQIDTLTCLTESKSGNQDIIMSMLKQIEQTIKTTSEQNSESVVKLGQTFLHTEKQVNCYLEEIIEKRTGRPTCNTVIKANVPTHNPYSPLEEGADFVQHTSQVTHKIPEPEVVSNQGRVEQNQQGTKKPDVPKKLVDTPASMPKTVNSTSRDSNTPDPQVDFDVDLLIIGSSHVSRLHKDRMYKNKQCHIQVLENKTIPGAMDYIKSCKLNPRCVLIQIGSNDLLTTQTKDCTHEKERMEELISLTTTRFNQATICISELLPRSLGNERPTDEYNRRIKLYNQWLQGLKLVKVISQQGFSAGDSTFYGRDGIHLTQKGTAQLVRNYKHVLNEVFHMKPYKDYKYDGLDRAADHNTRGQTTPQSHSQGHRTDRRPRRQQHYDHDDDHHGDYEYDYEYDYEHHRPQDNTWDRYEPNSYQSYQTYKPDIAYSKLRDCLLGLEQVIMGGLQM